MPCPPTVSRWRACPRPDHDVRLAETGQGRTLTLTARADDLEIDDLPPGWDGAPLAMLCPVINEVRSGPRGVAGRGVLGVLPQGWMRRREKGGLIVPQLWEDAAAVLAWAQIMVASEEDVAGFREDAVEWLQRVRWARSPPGAEGPSFSSTASPITWRRIRPTRWTRPGRGMSSPPCS
jgi:hypothetical protein